MNHGVTIDGAVSPAYSEVLTPEALDFVGRLHRTFNPARERLLERFRSM